MYYKFETKEASSPMHVTALSVSF